MSVAEWARQQGPLIWWGILVGLYVLATGAAVGFVLWMPADYFSAERRTHVFADAGASPLRWLLLIAKNVLGGAIVVLGLILLVFPGPGVMTLLIGVGCVDFPGKFRLECWLVARPRVLHTLNRLRVSAGREPLQPPRVGGAS